MQKNCSPKSCNSQYRYVTLLYKLIWACSVSFTNLEPAHKYSKGLRTYISYLVPLSPISTNGNISWFIHSLPCWQNCFFRQKMSGHQKRFPIYGNFPLELNVVERILYGIGFFFRAKWINNIMNKMPTEELERYHFISCLTWLCFVFCCNVE